jgi:hypothetical protein
MFDTHALLLIAALASAPDSAAHMPSANDSVLASVVTPLIKPGDRLRVRTGFSVTEGISGPVGLAGLQLRHEPADIWSQPRVEPIAWSQIERIDLRTHQPGSAARVGAALGCLVGLGVVMSAAAHASDSGYGGGALLLAGALGGISGGLVGAMLGALFDASVPPWKTIYERR